VAVGLRNTGQQVGGSLGLVLLGTVAFTVAAHSACAAAAHALAAAARARPTPGPASHAVLTGIYHHAPATGFTRALEVAAGIMLRSSPWSSPPPRSGFARRTWPASPRSDQLTAYPEETMKLTIIAAPGTAARMCSEQWPEPVPVGGGLNVPE
jgi:hypothetical protein